MNLLKKLLSLCFGFFCMLIISAPRPSRVKPIYYPGDYTPPSNCVIYEIPEYKDKGTYTIRFDECGKVDKKGIYKFHFTINEKKIVRWDSNFYVYGVLVKGSHGSNLYKYNKHVRSGEYLCAPKSKIVSVSIIFCICPIKPTLTPQPTKTAIITPSSTTKKTETPEPTKTEIITPSCYSKNQPIRQNQQNK